MADTVEDLTKRYLEKSAELRAVTDLQKHLTEVVRIAAFRKQVYAQGLKAVELDEKIENIDWWSRAVKIGAAAGIGMATGAWAGPVVISWLSGTSAAAWGASTTGFSAAALASLTFRSGSMVVSGQIQKRVSASGSATGSSLAGLFFESCYEQKYRQSLTDIKFQMLSWSDAALVPVILADDFEFIVSLERTYRNAALTEKIPASEAEHAKTRFCLEFWTKLEATLKQALMTNGWSGKIALLTGEVNQLKQQLLIADPKLAGDK